MPTLLVLTGVTRLTALAYTICRVRIPCGARANCAGIRRNTPRLLKPLRGDVGKNFKDQRGADYGVAIGLRPLGGYANWFAVVVATWYFLVGWFVILRPSAEMLIFSRISVYNIRAR